MSKPMKLTLMSIFASKRSALLLASDDVNRVFIGSKTNFPNVARTERRRPSTNDSNKLES